MNRLTNLDQSIQYVTLQQLVLSGQQPRRQFNAERLNELAVSIRARGVLQPILTRPVANGLFEIVAGERRYFAAKAARLQRVPIIVHAYPDDESLEVSLIENLQRQELTELEEAEGIVRLLGMRCDLSSEGVVRLLYRMDNEQKGKITAHNLDAAKVKATVETFEQLGRITWPSFVVTRLPLLKLPEDVLDALESGLLTSAQARLIARCPADQRLQLIQDTVDENLNLTQLRQRINGVRPQRIGWTEHLNAMRKNVATLDSEGRQHALQLLLDLEKLFQHSWARPLEGTHQ